MSKKNVGWTHILTTYGLLDEIEANGFARISTAQLNQWYPAVDARLMAKFDTLESRPQIFKENGLSLWPESNGGYVILKSEAPYIKIDPKKINTTRVQYLNARDLGFHLETLNFDEIKTEAQALAVLKYSRIMHHIHCANADRLALTDGGRNRLASNTLTVTFPTHKGRVAVPCEGVQMELDALHESDFMISATEAKIVRSSKGFDSLTSLHARQIAFPHSQLEGLVQNNGSSKTVRTGILYAWKKNAQNPWDFLWLPVEVAQGQTTTFQVAWEQAVRFVLVEGKVDGLNKYTQERTRSDLRLVDTGRPMSDAAFPQFNRISVIEHIAYDLGSIGMAAIEEELPVKTYRQWQAGKAFNLSKSQMAKVKRVDIDDIIGKFSHKLTWGSRNRNYLINDLRWLGLIEDYDPATHEVTPSALCMMMASVDPDVRTQRLWNLLMSSPVMRAVFENTPISQEMRNAEGLENDTVYARRLSTARTWIKDVSGRMDASPEVAYVK